MSIQWRFIAGYLYLEVGIIITLMLPLACPRRLHRFFKSRLFAVFQQRTAMYFYVLLGVLFLFLMDAIREMKKYSHSTDSGHVHLTSEMKGNVKLFRAQRNFYITGFAILLAFIIRRLITMIIIQGDLLERSENIIKEAEAAKELAKTTVLAYTLRSAEETDVKNRLETFERLLEEEKVRTKEIQEEALKWRLKYEEVLKNHSGKGDE